MRKSHFCIPGPLTSSGVGFPVPLDTNYVVLTLNVSEAIRQDCSSSGDTTYVVQGVYAMALRSCNGGVAKACGSFLYLGSLTDNKGSSGPEIRRRIKKTTETFQSLWRVWAMRGLPLKLKGRLYSAFVHSVLLYNCEFG